jgi:hypothetical protein
MNKKIYDKYSKILEQKTITESEIIYLRKALNVSLNYVNEDYMYAKELLFKSSEKPRSLSPEHTQKGIEYLNKKLFRLNGQLRRLKVNPFSEREIGIIKNFKKFLFVGLYNNSDNMRKNYVAVYRCVAKNGEWFDYTGVIFDIIRVV